MSCCGSRRAELRGASEPGSRRESAYWTAGSRAFVYTGHGQLAVTGPLTGTLYQFRANGGPILVHGADVASLASVPGLEPVR
jgi:hypothetical protein